MARSHGRDVATNVVVFAKQRRGSTRKAVKVGELTIVQPFRQKVKIVRDGDLVWSVSGPLTLSGLKTSWGRRSGWLALRPGRRFRRPKVPRRSSLGYFTVACLL
jgi:hypothetical protein